MKTLDAEQLSVQSNQKILFKGWLGGMKALSCIPEDIGRDGILEYPRVQRDILGGADSMH